MVLHHQKKSKDSYISWCRSRILYTEAWHMKVLEMTNGTGVNVVYESVGSTLGESFNATKIGGTVVFYGMAGGNPAPVDPRMLMDTSKTLTGGDLWNVLTTYEERKTIYSIIRLDRNWKIKHFKSYYILFTRRCSCS